MSKNKNLICVLFILLSFYILGNIFRIDFIIKITGLIFVAFLPGYLFNKIIQITKGNDIISSIGFSVTSSLALIILYFLFIEKYLTITKFSYLLTFFIFILILISIKILFDIFIHKKTYSGQISTDQSLSIDWFYILVALIPLGLFIARSLINPFLADMDANLYVKGLTTMEQSKTNLAIFNTNRPGFTQLVMAFHFITGYEFTALVKFILPAIAWTAFFSIFALFKKINNKKYINILLYLSILLSPSLINQIDQFKPETLSFILSFPAIILFLKAIEKKDFRLFLSGLIYSIALIKTHETGLIFLFSYLTGGLLYLFLNIKIYRQYFSIRNITLGTIIVLPYLFLFNLEPLLKIPLSLVRTFGANFHFYPRIWFLNKYSSVGMELGWEGWKFILFYAYNGILALTISLYLLVKNLFTKRISLAPFLPAIVLFIIYFLIAELLPRIGFFVLPDRAWNELFYSSIILFLSVTLFGTRFYQEIEKNKVIQIVLLINIVAAVLVSFIVTTLSGIAVSRPEIPLIHQIQKTPGNSVIISTQIYNNNLIENYGKRIFFPISPPNFSCYDAFDKLSNCIKMNIKNGKIDLTTKKLLKENITLIEKKEIAVVGSALSRTSNKILNEISNVQEIERKDYSDNPIFLLYSFTKTNGLMSKIGRNYYLEGVDIKHKSFFEGFKDNIYYKGPSGILIKIR